MVVRLLMTLLLVLQPISLSAMPVWSAAAADCQPISCCQVRVVTTCCGEDIVVPRADASADNCTCSVRQNDQPKQPAPRVQARTGTAFIESLLNDSDGVVTIVAAKSSLQRPALDLARPTDSQGKARARLGVWRI